MPPATRWRHKDGPQRDMRVAVGFLLIEANKRVYRPLRSALSVPLPPYWSLTCRQQQRVSDPFWANIQQGCRIIICERHASFLKVF